MTYEATIIIRSATDLDDDQLGEIGDCLDSLPADLEDALERVGLFVTAEVHGPQVAA